MDVRDTGERHMTEKGQSYTREFKQKELSRCRRKLQEVSKSLQELVNNKSSDIDEIRHAHADWLNHYEHFLEINNQVMSLLEEQDIEDHRADFEKYDIECRAVKFNAEQWILSHSRPQKQMDPEVASYTSSTSRSSRASSSVSAARVKESTRKAELLARAAAFKEKKQLEEEKLALRLKEEELNIKTELSVSDARNQILEELEKSMVHDEQELFNGPHQIIEPKVQLNPHVPEFVPRSYLQDDHVLSSSVAVARELNKPKASIQTFTGDPTSYKSFIRQFNARICRNTDCFEERLNYLLQFTAGEAHQIALGFSHLDAEQGYDAAMLEFKERYGDSDVIARSYIKKAMGWPVIKNGAKQLDQFSIFLTECQYAVKQVDAMRVLEHSENIRLLVQKLPFYLQERWRNIVYEIKCRNGSVKFTDFVSFIRKEAKKANDPIYGRDIMNGAQKNPSETITKNVAKGVTQSSRNPRVLSFATVSAETRERLSALSLKERYEHLKSEGLCFGCLKPGHVKRVCKDRLTCDTCKGRHPTLLHVDPRNKSCEESVRATVSATSMGAGISVNQALPIVPVTLKATNSNKYIQTYAFLDAGSTATFCTDRVADLLNIEGRNRNISITTMGHRKDIVTREVTGLEVSSIDNEYTIALDTVYCQPKMPVSRSDVVTKYDIEQWPHLRNLPLIELDSDVDLLIGVNVPRAMEPLDVIASQDEGPFAVRTLLGWVINGPLGTVGVDETCEFSVNFLRIENQNSLEEQLKAHYNLDFIERQLDDVKELSVEDKRFIKIMEQSIEFKDGHYTVGLPLRSDKVMPNNKRLAETRLALLGKRLSKDSEFCGQYVDFMNSIISKGYAERVTQTEEPKNLGRVWYLPHHGVFHPKKKKIRVVFDCAARFQGVSLNDSLLSGPNLTNTIAGTLLRFRHNGIAVMGDIESMFYQVRVPERDRDLQRFVWFKDGNPNAEPVEYRRTVHIFGSTSSPSCSNFALQHTAESRRGQFNEDVISTVLKNFYVDDCLKSLETVSGAIALIQDLKELLSGGGFNITKWISSSKEVMASIPMADRAKETVNLDLEQDDLPVERALGLNWCAESDNFCFSVEIRQHELTRRGLLSTISSIYDPLGFIAPLLLRAKMISQELCKLQLGWDDDIPKNYAGKWVSLIGDIQLLTDFKVRRCIKPEGFGQIVSSELHHFSDASESGYGVVTYVRLKNNKGEIHCSFVMGKSRVAPLKKVSVPRLELTAATVSVRNDKLLREELGLAIDKSVFWSDSMSVIRYIRNKTARFQTFVANRLAVIHEGSNPEDWHYVSTKINPADLASRGAPIDQNVWLNQWIGAPSFISKEEIEWPKTSEEGFSLSSENDPEVKKIKVNSTTVNTNSKSEVNVSIDKLFERYPSWYRLKRGVAWILKVRKKLLCRVRCKKGADECNVKCDETKITVSDMNEAEMVVLGYVQRQVYAGEVNALKQGQSVKRRSSLRQLDPCIDNGLLRVGGRLGESQLPEVSKHPVILPKKHHISTLILREIHSELKHAGRNHVLSRLREKFWLVNAPSAIRQVISKCVVCRRLKSRVGEQKMSSLPEDCVTPDEPPFTRVGVDFFGPFEVKIKRSHEKRYGVIFTCLASRAVHLEVASSLDTSFINALRRFIARRGPVTKIRSDNGTNFVGAEREIGRSISEWNLSQVDQEMLRRNIDWKFNPPAGSHHGGVWERLIKSVRLSLNSTLREQALNDENLQTLMCEIEYIINDRPITRLSDSCKDLDTLTPNQLLTLKSTHSLPPGIFVKTDNYVRKRWRQVQFLANMFWQRWIREYLPLLQERQKWHEIRENLRVGDIVLIVDSNAPRNAWPMGRVVETLPDKHGLVRQVKVKTATNVLTRPIDKLCMYLEAE